MDSTSTNVDDLYITMIGLASQFKCKLIKQSDQTHIEQLDESLNDYDKFIILCNMFGYTPTPYKSNVINLKGAAEVDDKIKEFFNSATDSTVQIDETIKKDTVQSTPTKKNSVKPPTKKDSVKPPTPTKKESVKPPTPTKKESVKPLTPIIKSNKQINTIIVSNSQYAHDEIYFLINMKNEYDFIHNKDPKISQQSFLFKKECDKSDIKLTWDTEKKSFKLCSNDSESFEKMKTLLFEMIENAKKSKKTIFKKVFIVDQEIIDTFSTTMIDFAGVKHNTHTFMLECKEDDVDFKWNKDYRQYIIESKNEEKFNEKCTYIETLLSILTDE